MQKTKQVLFFLFLTTCICSVGALASTKEGTDARIYSSKSNHTMLKASTGSYPTDVWVHNRSDYIVWVNVPGWVNDKLYPNDNDEIFSYDYYPTVHIVLSRGDGYVFFDEWVNNHSDVWVDNNVGARATQSGHVKPHVTVSHHAS